MAGALAIAAHSLQESLRRRVFLVVVALTSAFLVLYVLGVRAAFGTIDESFFSRQALVEEQQLVGSTIFGMAIFAVLFLGSILAVFLTIGAIRGDAERGLLQPIVVRPIGRSAFLVGRFAAAVLVCALYVALVFSAAAAITIAAGDWTPDRFVSPLLSLIGAVTIVAALSLLASALLGSTAQGIAVFMLLGAGLTAGLLGQISEAFDSDGLARVGEVGSWILPFEALYQDALHSLTEESSGFTGFVLRLGPFGGAQGAGPALWPFAIAYAGLALAIASWRFARLDL